MIRAVVYVHSSKESMYAQGEELKLSEKALEMFKYAFGEVALTVDIDPETGLADIVAVNGKPLAEKK